MTRVLVTNDDGVASPGRAPLVAAVASTGHEVVVAAPQEDTSGSGAAIGRLHANRSVDVQMEFVGRRDEHPEHTDAGPVDRGYASLSVLTGVQAAPPAGGAAEAVAGVLLRRGA